MNALTVSVVFGIFAMVAWGIGDCLIKGITGRIGAYKLLVE